MDALELSLSVMDITYIHALQESSIAVEKHTFQMRNPLTSVFFLAISDYRTQNFTSPIKPVRPTLRLL